MKQPNRKYLTLVSDILPGVSPEGHFCVGLVSALAWQSDVEPTRGVLEAASVCKSIPDAIAIFEAWLPLVQSKRDVRFEENAGEQRDE